MAIIRAAHERDFTIITNAALRDTNLSLKAKGLLALMLSEHDGWNFTIKGLSAKCKEGVDAVAAIVKELEAQGYVVRRRERSTTGHFTAATYTIYEKPIREAPKPEKSVLDKPAADKPSTVSPPTVKPVQSNIVPIGGLTSAEDKNPLSMVLQNVPDQVNAGTSLEEAVAGITAIVSFEEGVTKTVTAEELQFTAIPIADRHMAWKDPIFHSHHKYIGKFQTLGTM